MADQTEQPVMTVDEDGDKQWTLNGKLHRTDGPAVEGAFGSKYWYINGELHRTDGPAVEGYGYKAWWLNNIEYSHKDWKAMVDILNNFKKLGKVNLDETTEQPVMTVDKYGNKIWKLNGKFHRTDGPAYEDPDGRKSWWINGERHRTDGPAYEGLNGDKSWWINGIKYSHKDWKTMVNILNNFKTLGKLNLDEATEQPVMTVDKDGDKRW